MDISILYELLHKKQIVIHRMSHLLMAIYIIRIKKVNNNSKQYKIIKLYIK